MKGINVKDHGEHIFCLHFIRWEVGRKVDSGSWMFEKDLLVMEEFVERKTSDEYEFKTIPI
jgi:hypothetical protein